MINLWETLTPKHQDRFLHKFLNSSVTLQHGWKPKMVRKRCVFRFVCSVNMETVHDTQSCTLSGKVFFSFVYNDFNITFPPLLLERSKHTNTKIGMQMMMERTIYFNFSILVSKLSTQHHGGCYFSKLSHMKQFIRTRCFHIYSTVNTNPMACEIDMPPPALLHQASFNMRKMWLIWKLKLFAAWWVLISRVQLRLTASKTDVRSICAETAIKTTTTIPGMLRETPHHRALT